MENPKSVQLGGYKKCAKTETRPHYVFETLPQTTLSATYVLCKHSQMPREIKINNIKTIYPRVVKRQANLLEEINIKIKGVCL